MSDSNDQKPKFQPKRRSDLLTASKVLQRVLGNGKSALSDQFLRWKIWRFWPGIVGATLARYCEPVGYERGRLYVWVKSSARMQEIRFFENTLKEKVNEHVGSTWVRNIRFTLDRHGVPNAEEMSPEFKKFLDIDKDGSGGATGGGERQP